MNLKRFYSHFLASFLMIFLTSCVKDVDLDQLENVLLTPVFELDFIYAEFDTDDFVDPGLPPGIPITVPPIVDTINFDLVGTEFAVENLERIDFTFEIANTFQTGFEFEFQFLNAAGQPIGALYFINVLAGNGEGEAPVITREVISLDNATLNSLINTAQLGTEIRILNANSDLRGRIEVKSIAAYYIAFES